MEGGRGVGISGPWSLLPGGRGGGVGIHRVIGTHLGRYTQGEVGISRG